jgi:hypothetical protein
LRNEPLAAGASRHSRERRIDGGFPESKCPANANERHQAFNPPIVELARFDPQVVSRFFLGHQTIFDCSGLRIHTGWRVSKPPSGMCALLTLRP